MLLLLSFDILHLIRYELFPMPIQGNRSTLYASNVYRTFGKDGLIQNLAINHTAFEGAIKWNNLAVEIVQK
jgi:hypothetical protein